MKRGPFVAEWGAEFWLPIADWTYHEARSEAARHASDTDQKSRYVGKEVVTLHDHDDWESGGCDCRPEPSYAFEVYG